MPYVFRFCLWNTESPWENALCATMQSGLIIEKSMSKDSSSIFCAHKISPCSWKYICCWGCKRMCDASTVSLSKRVPEFSCWGGRVRLLSDDSVEINRSIAQESNFSGEETRTCSRVTLLFNKTEAKHSIPEEGQRKKREKQECEFVLQTCLMFILHTEWSIWQICFHIWLQRLVTVCISGQNESSREIIRQAS